MTLLFDDHGDCCTLCKRSVSLTNSEHGRLLLASVVKIVVV